MKEVTKSIIFDLIREHLKELELTESQLQSIEWAENFYGTRHDSLMDHYNEPELFERYKKQIMDLCDIEYDVDPGDDHYMESFDYYMDAGGDQWYEALKYIVEREESFPPGAYFNSDDYDNDYVCYDFDFTNEQWGILDSAFRDVVHSYGYNNPVMLDPTIELTNDSSEPYYLMDYGL